MAGWQRFAVLGAGAWGTALAHTLCVAGREVTIWARQATIAEEIGRRASNEAYLPGVRLAAGIEATTDLSRLATADAILVAVPAQHLRGVAGALAPHLGRRRPLPIICCKGIEIGTNLLPAGILEEVWGAPPAAVLSGPSFAAEVARGLPTALTLAERSRATGLALAAAMGHPAFRLYWSPDVAGVQLLGATKNVLAIAAGIVAGRRLGANALAALVTRGNHELGRFARRHGARAETVTGLAGLGDLVLTCTSPQSRNFSLGVRLGEGRSLAEAQAAARGVCEGVPTVRAVMAMARAADLEMPICAAIEGILEGSLDVEGAIAGLLARPLKAEH